MYKILNKTQGNYYISYLNEKTAQLYDNCADLRFGELILHAIQDKCAIDLNRIDIVEQIRAKFGVSVITDYWLVTDTVENLPEDFNWLFMQNSIRITIPNYLILKSDELTQLINYIKTESVNHYITENYSYIYVSYILPEHQTILNNFSEILIETKN